jgi:hypothetical protein
VADDLCEVLTDELAGGLTDELTEPEPADLERIASLYGATPREQNPLMAQVLAGTTDKSSREYRSAIRLVQRFRTRGGEHRTPNPSSLRRLAGVARSGGTRRFRNGANVVIRGWIRVSKDLRRRTVAATIDAERITPTLDAWRAGDPDRACDDFLEAFVDAYSGVPVMFETVESFRMQPAGGV